MDTEKSPRVPGAIVQLDRYHLLRDLRRLYGGEIAKEMAWVLKQGHVEGFLNTLEALIDKTPTVENRAERRGFVRFLKKYKEHLKDYRLRLPEKLRGLSGYGMGAAETYVDKKLANRMKKRGMYWSREGAHAMAVVLMLRANNELKRHLSEIRYHIANPVQKAETYRQKKQRDWSEWLRCSLPAIHGPHQDRIWAKALRKISRPT